MTQQLFEQWFRLADGDKDGAVGGAEAVSFFTRSGLPQGVLGQIWELASGGAAKLNQFQFSSAMRLVALAQVRGGQLPLDQARAIVAGVGPSLPPPTLQGLDVPGSARPQGPSPAPPAAQPYATQATGGAAAPAGVPPPYAAQVTGAGAGAGVTPGMPYAAQVTGAVPYAAQVTGGATSGAVGGAAPIPAAGGAGGAASVPAGYPPLPVADLQRFQATFAQLDLDRDGFLTGAECFSFFSQSGLDKSVLRDIWNLVAGNQGRLAGPQFVSYLYLIDCCKRGMPLPQYLPPGLAGFPPVAAAGVSPLPPAAAAPAAAPPLPPAAPVTWSLQSQFGTSSNINAVLSTPAVTPMAAPPAPPSMPARLDLSSGERLAPPQVHTSHVPMVPAGLLASVSAMDRTKLQEEQQVCEAKEKALQTAEERAAEARARQAHLTTALQELVVFRNRTEVALLTSQDQARRLEEEVEATRKRYETGYTAAQAASEKSAVVHLALMDLMAQKAELEEKNRRLESEVAAAERMGPADVARLEGELAELASKCTALEAARAAKMAKVDGIRKAQEAARSHLAALQDADRDAAAEVEGCQAALEQLEAELKAARASGSHTSLPALLSRAAALYRGLYGMAQRVGTALPFEALPVTLTGLHVWADEVAAGVVDWADDDVDARGYVLVNALPGADAPRPIIKAAATAPPAATPAVPVTGAALSGSGGSGSSGHAKEAQPKMLPDDFAAHSGAGGFGDAPAFGDPPAFGDAAAFPDPPAFTGAPAFAPAGSSGSGGGSHLPATLAPPQPQPAAAAAPNVPAPPAGSLEEVASLAHDVVIKSRSGSASDPAPGPSPATASAAPAPGGAAASQVHDFASGFSFGTETATAAPHAPAAAPTVAVGDFHENAFAAPVPTSAPAAASAGGASAAGAAGWGFEDAPAFTAAAPDQAPTAAPVPLPPQPAAAPAAETAAPFGGFDDDNAFGGFESQPPESAGTSVGQAESTTSPPPPEAAVPAPLPPADSGALDVNPFVARPLPGFGSALPVGSGGGSTGGGGAPKAQVAVGGFEDGFGESAFGVAAPSATPPTAPAAPLHSQGPVTGAGSGASGGGATAPTAAAAPALGFQDDNPFGDNDNPFGAPAFPQ